MCGKPPAAEHLQDKGVGVGCPAYQGISETTQGDIIEVVQSKLHEQRNGRASCTVCTLALLYWH